MSSRILGLDIRNHGIFVVVVHTGLKTQRVEAHFEVPLTGQGEFKDQLSVAVSEIVERVDTRDVFCQVALPSDWIVYRNVTVPIKGRGKIRQILPYELEPSLAQPIEGFTFDFKVAATIEPGNESHLVVSGVEIVHLQTCLDVLKEAKIDPDLITAGSSVLAGCLSKVIDLAAQTALVAMGKRTCDIYLLLAGQIGMARTFRLPSGERSDTGMIGAYLNQTILAFEERFNLEFDPETVYLNQVETSSQNDTILDLKENNGYQVEIVDLAAAAGMPVHPDTATWHPQRMNNALALCLARIRNVKTFNFRRGEYGKRLFLAEWQAPLLKVAILAGVVLMLGVLSLVIDGYYTRKNLNRLDQQIVAVFSSTFPEVHRIVDPLQQMRVKIEEEKKKSTPIAGVNRDVLMIDMLNDISRLIPKSIDVTLTGMSFGVENMILSGHAGQFKMVNDIRALLEKADWVDAAIISSANQSKSGRQVDFKIKLVFSKGAVHQNV
ncbi:MAG: hypothetical protein DSY89_06960 [Deltaproteobacteria bacterium]|nr:MAG: hypothetical protein DSY89_06960 [Deltaproteobacteria bacterium]